jgi:gas vesicle protein GvpL/GvpF
VSSTGWYVYGVVDADREPPLADAIRLVAHGSVAAAVAEVDLTEFGDLETKLNDRAWLEQKALEHERVLSGLARGGAVVPLRFGAIYEDLDAVAGMLAERREELEADLERVRGRVEVGVKGFVERRQLEEVLAHERAAAPVASAGRAYLERRQAQRHVADEASAIVAEAARSTHEQLLRRSVEGTVSRPHSRELSGRREEMFLNAAYLVPAGDDSLRGEVDALGRAYAPLSLSFEVTGPWPPYNFVGRQERA